jgi:hypothetical protein
MSKPVAGQYGDMFTNWTSRLAPLASLFRAPEQVPAEFRDRDAERMRHDLDLIRIRFPHHA